MNAQLSEAAPLFISPVMLKINSDVDRVAGYDAPVLITGESGTGKEVVADLLHQKSKRAAGPFVKLNCAAMPRDLIESELFGHVKGAFTGAYTPKTGLFRTAEGGTIFLDELGEMPIELQSKLLRVLQSKIARPVGGTQDYRIDCRVLAATNRGVADAIASNRLRADLYYRLAKIEIEIPPLRERKEEILPLAGMFLKLCYEQHSLPVRKFAPDVEETFQSYPWPGNVRQLQNVVERSAFICTGAIIEKPDIAFLQATPVEMTPWAKVERAKIEQALTMTNGNKARAAELLEISRPTLYSKIECYKLTHAATT